MTEMQNTVGENTERKINDLQKFRERRDNYVPDGYYNRTLDIYRAGQIDIIIDLLDDIAESLRVLSERDDM